MTAQALRETDPVEFAEIQATAQGAISQMVCGTEDWNVGLGVQVPVYGVEAQEQDTDFNPSIAPK